MFFLLGQLREQLSYLKGDNFFRFTCSDCSADGKEQYERLKLTWQQVSTELFSRHQVGWPKILGSLSRPRHFAVVWGWGALQFPVEMDTECVDRVLPGLKKC